MYNESDEDEEYGACSCDTVEVDGTLTENIMGDLELWKTRLERYRRRFNPNELGPYDIVVVLTGTNDLKIMLCPCLIVEEDRELRRRNRGGGLIEDLTALIQNISARMRRGMRNFSERATRFSLRVRGNTEELESMLDSEAASSERSPTLVTAVSDDTSCFGDDNESCNPTNGWSHHQHQTPLFVLPAMPIRTSPSVRPIPLRWLTIPFFDMMEAKKRKLASRCPGELLWVRDPSLKQLIEYEEERGVLWEQKNREEILLSLRHIKGGDCGEITEAMHEYYQNRSGSFDYSTPLFQRPGTPGTKVFSADRIHPNEAGYELWARHIAIAIVADMKKRKQLL